MRRGEQPPWIVSDGLWQRIEPLFSKTKRRQRFPGRKRIPDRQVLCEVLFVLYTAIPREFLPHELGFGSGMTCWRRLAEWRAAGRWQRLHEVLLAELSTVRTAARSSGDNARGSGRRSGLGFGTGGGDLRCRR
ncbi:transposase [Micromonospora purpureochromogenes]|uniref:transposase n=1 Tax=Micromonospora purpureochromogenes TaxID=47872 RepID=UPI0033D21363